MLTIPKLIKRLERLENALRTNGFSLKQPAECKHGVQDNACISCYMDKTDQTPAEPMKEPVALPICNLWVDPITKQYVVDHCDHPIEELIPAYAAPVQPVKQEPVASVVAMLDKCISIIGTEMNHCKQDGDKWFMCLRFIHAIQGMQYEFKRDYAAPVSAKREWVDLTVSDLDAIIEKHYDDEMDLKAMILDGIAAFKDKNK